MIFAGKSQDYLKHEKGDRASIVRHTDNLKMEGKMETRALNATFTAGDKASIVRHGDNLKLEGSMDTKRRDTVVLKGERHGAVKREDNLKMEGSFEGRVQASSATQVSQSSTSKSSRQRLESREKSNIMMGDDSHMASTSRLHTTSKSNKESRTSSLASSSLQTSVTKSNQSSAIAGAIVQTGKDEASISAVNTDKFASSLRESSAVAIGQQKEMSVIENHRKQSLQKQRNDNWDTRATGFSVGEAHTGRTSAYGGRDYEYSANIASRGASSTKQSGSWATQEYSGRNAGYSSKTSLSSTRQEHSASSSGFRQEQSAGYARHLGSSHSGAALIRSEHAVSSSSRHEASSSSAYQSTAQQSYRGQQNTLSETRVERTTPSRRKTWAESSILHGGASNIGSTIYAQDFHQHTCPASKVYTTESPFRYERQSSSGHKMFQPKDNLNNTR